MLSGAMQAIGTGPSNRAQRWGGACLQRLCRLSWMQCAAPVPAVAGLAHCAVACLTS